MAEDETLCVVCAGDSITGWSDLEQYLKWSHILECMLEARLGSGKAVVLNRGYGGNTTTDLLARLGRDVIAERPDIVVLLIGGNDAGQRLPRETTAGNLRAILKAIQDDGAKVLVLQYHVLSATDREGRTWSHINSNNELIGQVAGECAAPVLDMMPPMRNALREHSTGALVSVRDGVHLSPAGELVYARTVFSELDRLGWLRPGGSTPSRRV